MGLNDGTECQSLDLGHEVHSLGASLGWQQAPAFRQPIAGTGPGQLPGILRKIELPGATTAQTLVGGQARPHVRDAPSVADGQRSGQTDSGRVSPRIAKTALRIALFGLDAHEHAFNSSRLVDNAAKLPVAAESSVPEPLNVRHVQHVVAA